MIELYRPHDCAACADYETALKEMVIAHKVIVVENDQMPEGLPNDAELPALKDNGEVITGQAAITARLKELQKFIHDWNMFQGDACYVEEDEDLRFC
ncbi:MAG: hypothetical protein R3264_05210 [Anaerolineae bacterium]|nr:hypothetical protein [Anaerolineae bacterium]